MKLDHLIIAANNLESGAQWLEKLLGVPLEAGGKHAFMGTHNRLLRLGNVYLEVIAIDPNAPARMTSNLLLPAASSGGLAGERDATREQRREERR